MTRPVALALLLAVTATPLDAQGGRIPRKWLLAGVGALSTGAIATFYAVSFERNQGGCSKPGCVITVSTALGAVIGFLIGSELDKLYALRYSHAPPIDVRGRELPLAVEPNDLFVADSTVLVTGTEGIELVRAGPLLERVGFRARGLRGIGPLAVNDRDNRLLVGSTVGLYRFPLRGDEPGTLAFAGEISALSADGTWLALGLGPAIQLTRAHDSVIAAGDAATTESRIVDLAWQGDSLLWALTETDLSAYARRGDTLQPLGTAPFPTLARRMSVVGSMALVAAGSGGVYAVDLRDPVAPAQLANWSGARFVYDVAARDSTVYVAGGPEGLYILRLGPDGFVPVGLSRGVGFVAAIEAGPDAIYLLDRTGVALRRLDPLRE